MLVFLRTPIGRWVAISFLLPLIATALSALGRFLQRRSGHPTRVSKALLWVSTFVNKRLNRGQPATDTPQRTVGAAPSAVESASAAGS